MATAFAAQLRSIALNSTHELDLRARRNAHAESLLFPKESAAKQDFETIYAICIEGFQELCLLDVRFSEFERNLFSLQSVQTEREQMNKDENEVLDKVLERFLTMLSGKLLLKPGLKCLEWLVRRFRVHVHNTSALLLAVLPWHETNVWRNVLSVIPKEKCTAEWKMLGLYKEEALNIPRKAVVYAMTNNDGFFALLNNYVLINSKEGITYPGLLKFWMGILIEAVVGRLDATRSGRKEVERQRVEDLLLKVLPVLSDGFEIRDSPDLTVACFTLTMLLVGKANLDDRVLDSLLRAVAIAAQYTETEKKTAVITIIVIVGQKQHESLPKQALDFFMSLTNLEAMLQGLREGYAIGSLMEALVTGALHGLKNKNVSTRLAFVERVFRYSKTLVPQTASTITHTLLSHVLKWKADEGVEDTCRIGLIDLLQRLNEEQEFSTLFEEAARKADVDLTHLESLIGSTVAITETNTNSVADTMDVDAGTDTNANLNDLLAQIPSRTVDTTSFLANHNQHLYDQLVNCFTNCCQSVNALREFSSLQIWQTSELLICSFLMRAAVSSITTSQKAASLRLLLQRVLDTPNTIHAQAILPYALITLSDTSKMVRKASADLIIALSAIESSQFQDLELEDLYENGSGEEFRKITPGHLQKIITQGLIPSIEECVLDASQIASVIQHILNGSDVTLHTPTKPNRTELKKSLRHDLFKLLELHAIATPLLRIKVAIIGLLRGVQKVGIDTKSKALTPLLEIWSSYDQVVAEKAAEAEQLSLNEIDVAMAQIVAPQDKGAIGRVLTLIALRDTLMRPDFASVLFTRIQDVWKELKHEVQVTNSQRMFEFAFSANPVLSRGAQGILRSINLTTDALGIILELSMSGMVAMQVEEQPKKRRRVSHGRDSVPPDLARMLITTSSQLTFALELVDESNPSSRPELLPVLFDVLASLKRWKQQQRLDFPYLHNICLSNILTIVEAQQSLIKPTIDVSSIRADLVTDCIRAHENPQVRTTALLLSSRLAAIAPDRMLHNVMPILTFMGQNVISKDDDHSVYVVNQAIDMLVPALVTSLRKQNRDLIKSTSGLLASFTAAFDHIPQHRRVDTYVRLLDRMGSQEFTFVLLAMLVKRKSQSDLEPFMDGLLTQLDPYVQLITIERTIQLARDLLLSESESAECVFVDLASTAMHERFQLSSTMFKVALHILKSKSLKSRVGKLHRLDANLGDKVRAEIDNCFRLILATIRDCRQNDIDDVEECKQCLDALLALPSIVDLFGIIPQVLSDTDIDADLKPQALRVLATKLQRNPLNNSKVRTAAIDLLVKLTKMLQAEKDVSIKQAIIVCIDPLCEGYGRNDTDAVISAATIVASDQCIGSGDRRLEIMSLLCLASAVEVLKVACTPIVPDIITRIKHILSRILQQPHDDDEAHNAAFALLTATVTHVPFLVSDDSLEELLILISTSATKHKSVLATDSRKEAASTMAREIDLTSLFKALLGEDLSFVRQHPDDAELESLDMISTILQTAPKANVTRNADIISQLLLAHLAQRGILLRIPGIAEEEFGPAIGEVEGKLNIISIQFIHKLNDTAFRPIFESWVDWASNAHDVKDVALRHTMKPGRQTSLFGILNHFFNNLKSIVTSYASYIIPLAHDTLKKIESQAKSTNSNQLSIDLKSYTALLTMLQSMFTHDVDAFYNAPSHFEPIAAPLVAQLRLAATKSLRNTVYSNVIPAIISLATATLDTPSHHQALSHELVQLRHSSSNAVRLASIKAFATITAHEDVGEEFIANVIGIGSGEGEGARGIGGGGSVGEVMIYVNEMLEDDDEEVEQEVRKWVQVVRERTGEDVFEV